MYLSLDDKFFTSIFGSKLQVLQIIVQFNIFPFEIIQQMDWIVIFLLALFLISIYFHLISRSFH